MWFVKSRAMGQEVRDCLTRLADMRSLDKMRAFMERRCQQRTELNMGIWIIPMNGDSPDIAQAYPAVTKDLSSTSLGVITNRLAVHNNPLLCFRSESDVIFLRASIQSRKCLGCGWFLLGLEVTEVVDQSDYPELDQFAESVGVWTWGGLKKAPPPAEPSTRDCPKCCSSIPIKASRCPHCTSDLAA